MIKELSLDKPGAQPLKVGDSIYQEAHFKKGGVRQVKDSGKKMNSEKWMEGIPRYVDILVDAHRQGPRTVTIQKLCEEEEAAVVDCVCVMEVRFIQHENL